nr:unnamed protein product [Callosobruchus chinensis]
MDQDEYDSIANHPLEYETVVDEDTDVLKGNRIVDLKYVLQWALDLQVQHSRTCTVGRLKIKDESRFNLGLASCITFKCNYCDIEIKKYTEDPDLKSNINYGAVWGALSTGNTFSHLKELLSMMDIPPMAYSTFQKIENDLAFAWKEELWSVMEKAGQEEKAMAIDNNQVDENGVPWTTVYLDGGWSHRSYGHNYNAASGAAVIIGKHTGKLLYLGVRNKYCSICARASHNQQQVKSHHCFKNWDGSSAAMEADIIVQGFQESEQTHGLKYLKFIADGDSSVHAKIKREVSYGQSVMKIECVNHSVKNYGKALYTIKGDTRVNVAGRKMLTAEKIKSLQAAAMKAIYVNAKEDVENLKTDLKCSLKHTFGDHSECSIRICNETQSISNNIEELKSTGVYHHIYGRSIFSSDFAIICFFIYLILADKCK